MSGEQKKKDVVLTVYLDLGGDLQFHAGDPGSFAMADMTVLRQFFIHGEIYKESGLDGPIPVRSL